MKQVYASSGAGAAVDVVARIGGGTISTLLGGSAVVTAPNALGSAVACRFVAAA